MRLVQYRTEAGDRRVAMVESEEALRVLDGTERVYDLAREAGRSGRPLTELVEGRLGGQRVEYGPIAAEGRLLPPLDHPDPARLVISGTGLDHLGSAQARDAMHQKLNAEDEEALTDSMRMFRLGLEGGKPAPGQVGVAPEWFYKGDGRWLVPPEQPLTMPAFALEGSEEPELVGCYVIGDDGAVLCVGFALGNEFSDHVLERKNYLYLAHSKLRQSSCGPELLLGDPPAHIEGTSRILRDGRELWAAPFPDRRGQHDAQPGEPSAPSLQVRAVPHARRCTSAFLRHGHAQLRRRHPDPSGRCVRNQRAGFWPTAAQRVDGYAGG